MLDAQVPCDDFFVYMKRDTESQIILIWVFENWLHFFFFFKLWNLASLEQRKTIPSTKSK